MAGASALVDPSGNGSTWAIAGAAAPSSTIPQPGNGDMSGASASERSVSGRSGTSPNQGPSPSSGENGEAGESGGETGASGNPGIL